MKTLIIDTKNPSIKVDNNTIIVNDRRVPFTLIDTILIFSSFQLNSKDITKISNAGKAIVLVDYKLNSTLILSTKAKNSEFKIAQYEAFINKRLELAKFILIQKVNQHNLHLKNLGIIISITDILEKINSANDINNLLGIEGSFSKLYFDHYFTKAPKLWHNNKRTKRPPKDPLNALLSFGYTLFYNHISIRLIASGFEPYIGFLHTPFRNHNALSSDILELFRADINDFILNIVKNKTILLDDFTKKGGVYLRYDGRKKLYKHWQKFLDNHNTKLTQILFTLKEKFYE
jgi:CRISPR-associated protein Cas1